MSDIVRLCSPPSRSWLLGLLGRGAAREVAPDDAFQTLVLSSFAGGDGARVQVCSLPQRFDLPFACVVADKSGHQWDLVLSGSWSVAEARRFLDTYALALLAPGSALSKQVVESWIGNSVRDRVRDAARGQGVQELLEQDALPTRWWETRLGEWLGPFGVAVKLSAARWVSADAARAQAEQRREEDLAKLARQREQERKAGLLQYQDNLRYEAEKKRMEEDVNLSAAQRTRELELLERKHRSAVLAAELQSEELRRQGEKAALEHELQMARLRSDIGSVQSAEQRQRDSDARHEQVVEELRAAQKALERLSTLSEPILQKLTGKDRANSFQAAERLVSPEFNVPAAALAAMGFAATPQALVDLVKRRQAGASPAQSVKLEKEEFVTRDIGASKVKALRIGSSLQFKFTSCRDGHVAVINIGTSGKVWLQVPNHFRNGNHALARADQTYYIPGDELLPWPYEYIEEGPAGWEHIAVIVSDAPVVPTSTVARSSADSPFVEFSAEELDVLIGTLAGLPESAWCSAIYSFLVVS